MSNYHILTADTFGNQYQIIMHVPVPDVVNGAGINYRAAVVQYQGGAPIASSLPWITGAEQTSLDSGEIVERSAPFHSNPNQTLTQKRDAIDIMFADKTTEVQDDLGNVLEYWGYDRDVP